MGQNWIEGISTHEPPEPPGFTIDQNEEEVTITASGGYTFRAREGDQWGTGRMKLIQVAPGVTGTVTVSVYDWDTQENGPGAHDVWNVDLSNAEVGRLGAFRIAGDYGNVDPELGGPIHASHAACLGIGGDVVNEISLDLYGSGYVDGDVQIDGNVLAPALNGAIISGSLTINGNVLSPVTPVGAHGTITVAGLVSAPFVCGFNSDDVRFTATGTHTADIELGFIWPEHTLEIAGSSAASVELPELEGSISCAGSLAALTVNGLLTPDSTITIGQNAGTITLGQGYHWFCGTRR